MSKCQGDSPVALPRDGFGFAPPTPQRRRSSPVRILLGRRRSTDPASSVAAFEAERVAERRGRYSLAAVRPPRIVGRDKPVASARDGDGSDGRSSSSGRPSKPIFSLERVKGATRSVAVETSRRPRLPNGPGPVPAPTDLGPLGPFPPILLFPRRPVPFDRLQTGPAPAGLEVEESCPRVEDRLDDHGWRWEPENRNRWCCWSAKDKRRGRRLVRSSRIQRRPARLERQRHKVGLDVSSLLGSVGALSRPTLLCPRSLSSARLCPLSPVCRLVRLSPWPARHPDGWVRRPASFSRLRRFVRVRKTYRHAGRKGVAGLGMCPSYSTLMRTDHAGEDFPAGCFPPSGLHLDRWRKAWWDAEIITLSCPLMPTDFCRRRLGQRRLETVGRLSRLGLMVVSAMSDGTKP